jgi:hypothetical protein
VDLAPTFGGQAAFVDDLSLGGARIHLSARRSLVSSDPNHLDIAFPSGTVSLTAVPQRIEHASGRTELRLAFVDAQTRELADLARALFAPGEQPRLEAAEVRAYAEPIRRPA